MRLADRSGQPISREDAALCFRYGLDPTLADDIDELRADILNAEFIAEHASEGGRWTLDALIADIRAAQGVTRP